MRLRFDKKYREDFDHPWPLKRAVEAEHEGDLSNWCCERIWVVIEICSRVKEDLWFVVSGAVYSRIC
jgi:hypothetical protein